MEEKDWKNKLTEEQYRILREKATEKPFSGKYNMHFENGIYCCAACKSQLFESNSKFDSGCGWPSFDLAIEGSIKYEEDYTLGMKRVEILCANCNSHLGHIFDDGPTETGRRYCVNSVSLDFNSK